MPRTPTTAATLALTRLGLPFVAHVFEHDPRTDAFGTEAAAALGADPARVFKTLVADADGALVVGVLPVAAMLDLKALAAAIGRKRAVLAEPGTAERRTGYVLGGISPIGQRTPLPVVVDASAAELPTLFVSGGRRGLEVELAPADLLAASGGRFAGITR